VSEVISKDEGNDEDHVELLRRIEALLLQEKATKLRKVG
jgi:hypothetical protein